jgi:hypothetical protein
VHCQGCANEHQGANCVAGAVFGEVSNGAEFIFAWKAQGLVELQG